MLKNYNYKKKTAKPIFTWMTTLSLTRYWLCENWTNVILFLKQRQLSVCTLNLGPRDSKNLTKYKLINLILLRPIMQTSANKKWLQKKMRRKTLHYITMEAFYKFLQVLLILLNSINFITMDEIKMSELSLNKFRCKSVIS